MHVGPTSNNMWLVLHMHLHHIGYNQGSTAERYLAIYINIFTYICLIFVPVFIDVHFICSFTENP
jgi:hypothetical protein